MVHDETLYNYIKYVNYTNALIEIVIHSLPVYDKTLYPITYSQYIISLPYKYNLIYSKK